MKPPLINIKNASVMRGDFLALNKFNLNVAQGENLAILGPNGAGKSTLLKLIGRELYPLVKEQTKVEILGEEHSDLREYKRHLGLICQDLQASYEENTPGLEVVISGFFASISLWQHHDILPEQVEKALGIMSKLQIEDLSDRLFGELSTGQQRRLLLARALVHSPKTLILDEPTSGMDLKTCFQYLKTLDQLLKNGNALILVTHRIHEIPAMIDRVVFIKEGKNIFDGSKQEALTGARLSELFETELHVIEKNGLYQVYPPS